MITLGGSVLGVLGLAGLLTDSRPPFIEHSANGLDYQKQLQNESLLMRTTVYFVAIKSQHVSAAGLL